MLAVQKLLQGSASNVARLTLSIVVALILPPLLVRHLSTAQYNAWVLILQLTSYVTLLDLGLQNIVGKLFAENHAQGEYDRNHHLLSTSFVVLAGISCTGLALVAFMVWRVPALFQQMPPVLAAQVRIGLGVMGTAAAISLAANPFLSTFTGLQEYGFPTTVGLLSRFVSAIILVALIERNGSLLQLTCVLATVNVLTAAAQYIGWRRYVRARIRFTLWHVHRATARLLFRSGGVLAIWTIGGLFVNGLDLVIVGHFDYAHTGVYSLATNGTNFMLLLVTSLLSPLLPAVAAMHATSTPEQIGDVTLRSTRYCALLLVVISIPLMVFGYPLMATWVGPTYARQVVPFLNWLVISNCIRQLGYPYSLVVIATGKQNLATLATVSEALINVIVSVVLAQHIGAVGVAVGTFVGACTSLSLHLAVSMRLTAPAIRITPADFVLKGIGKPLLCTLPSIVLLFFWHTGVMMPTAPIVLALWVVVSVVMLYFGSLTLSERSVIRRHLAALTRS